MSTTAFPNFMQMPRRLPIAFWHVARVISVLATVAICVVLFLEPKTGLRIFWGYAVPLLPLVFLLAPGLWRNICPLAATNQIPRLLKFTRGKTLPDWVKEHGYLIAVVMLFIAIPTRKLLFNSSGPATALLIGGALVAAFTGGILYKGKSGWCSTICPLLPVQRMYGQTPFVTLPNSHCQPCVGCTKNCYDFNPPIAYLADLNTESARHRLYRKFFVGAFPGVVLGFFTINASGVDIYTQFTVFILASAVPFFVIESLLEASSHKLTTIYVATAINIFYYYSFPKLFSGWAPDGSATVASVLLAVITAIWIVRTYLKEPIFLSKSNGKSSTSVPSSGGATPASATAGSGGSPEVKFMPEGRTVAVDSGSCLLEIAEGSDCKIEAGCRMGVCGADPIAVLEGMENLSPISDDERGTLDRLGLGEGARMACCAKVSGPVTISLDLDALGETTEGAAAIPTIPSFPFDAEVKHVVIIGNGIAGVTVADQLRRRHPDCEIDLVAEEPHHLYNRMGISRLVYGRSAMKGLYLQPEEWYEKHRVNTWLNTRALEIDRDGKTVTLGTGDKLPYDRLVLATGSSSFVPPITGYGIDGSFVLRQADDAIKLRAYAQLHRCQNAVVAGGGLLGLEAAYALSKLGLNVTVLELSERLLSRQLDQAGSTLLQNYLQSLGLNIVTDCGAGELTGEERLQEVKLSNGESIPADLFLVAAGIKPNIELAVESELEHNRGVLVDHRMCTSDESIYAVGDAAEYKKQVQGLWPTAVDQAEVAAVNVAGGEEMYRGTVPATILKVVGVDLLSVGQIDAAEGETEIALKDEAAQRYRKLVIDADGRVIGTILFGYPKDASLVTAAVKSKLDVSKVIDHLRAGRWEALNDPENFNTQAEQVEDANLQQDAETAVNELAALEDGVVPTEVTSTTNEPKRKTRYTKKQIMVGVAESAAALLLAGAAVFGIQKINDNKKDSNKQQTSTQASNKTTNADTAQQRAERLAAAKQRRLKKLIPPPSTGEPSPLAAQLNQEGYTLIASQQFDAALQKFDAAGRLVPRDDPEFRNTLFGISRALRLSGRPEDAIIVLEYRLSLPPKSDLAKQELKLAKQEAGR